MVITTQGEYNFVRACFIAAAMISAATIFLLYWNYTEGSPIMRVITAALAGAIIFGGLAAALNWVDRKQPVISEAAKAAEAPETKNSPNISAGGNVNIGHIGDNVINSPPVEKPKPENFGVLRPAVDLIFSPFANSYPRLEVGNSGVFFDQRDEIGEVIFRYLRRDQFKIELIDGHYKFSTRITDENDKPIAEIIRNEWKVAPPPGAWDRNYNDDTLEVKDSNGDIIFQVQALPDRVRFRGVWWTDKSPWAPLKARVAIYVMEFWDMNNVDGQWVPKLNHRSAMFQKIRSDTKLDFMTPIFKYPSELHLGELAGTEQK